VGGAVAGAGGVSGGGAEGGSSAVSGSSGSSGVGAEGGVAGSFGSGGAAGSFATGGTGGVSEPECTSEEDCLFVNSCCECTSHAVGVPVERCEIETCAVSTCEARNIPATRALCRAGRCVLDVGCDASQVLCRAAAPDCPAGAVPAVLDTCWTGGCVPVTECAGVTNCTQCGADQGCVEYMPDGLGGLSNTYHCTTPASGCQSDRSCACFGLSVCMEPFVSCGDSRGDADVACACPTC
jgi:hypothetical protein